MTDNTNTIDPKKVALQIRERMNKAGKISDNELVEKEKNEEIESRQELDLRKSKKGYILKTPYNAKIALESLREIREGVRYNEFTKTIEKTMPTPWGADTGFWSDEDTLLAIGFVDENMNFSPTREHVDIAILQIAKKNSYHPIKERIEQKTWDGRERAERYFIDLLGCEDTVYNKEVTRLWLTGLIARIYSSGVKFEIVPILVGGQGIGKSTATKRLLPDYHSDDISGFGKGAEDYRKLENSAIVEFGELKGMKKAAIEDVKNFLSASHDNIRALYSRVTEKVPRHCVFIGTSNAKGFLKDEGKERRFYPIACGVSVVGRHPMEIEEDYFLQVLAEAKMWYDQGLPLTVSKELDSQLEEIQQAYKIEDTDKENILVYLNHFKPPLEWYELSPYERRQYFLKSLGEPLDDNEKNTDYPLPFGDEPLEYTSPNEVAYIVFNENVSRGRGGNYAQKARDVLDSLTDWEREAGQKRLWKNGTPTSRYKRKR